MPPGYLVNLHCLCVQGPGSLQLLKPLQPYVEGVTKYQTFFLATGKLNYIVSFFLNLCTILEEYCSKEVQIGTDSVNKCAVDEKNIPF